MADTDTNKILAEPVGVNRHTCGYCKSSDKVSVSFGFRSNSVPTEFYEQLMLKGWRRCGDYFYRPINHLTCCPMYTIRLRVSDFKPSKSQKKVLKTVSKHFVEQSFNVEINEAEYTEEKYLLYKKYQMEIHGDKEEDLTTEGFRSFLVTSPLYSENTIHGINKPFGTYHQEYRCNGNLLAVGVLDILPSGVSSVYFFYDPQYRELSLGKYSAMNEISLSGQIFTNYYYMGYYIESCEKMKYKGDYKPSELLCPVTLKWFQLSTVLDRIDGHKCCPLDDEAFEKWQQMSFLNLDAIEDLFSSTSDLTDRMKEIPIILSAYGVTVYLSQLNERGQEVFGQLLLEFAKYVPFQELSKLAIKC